MFLPLEISEYHPTITNKVSETFTNCLIKTIQLIAEKKSICKWFKFKNKILYF